MIYLSLKSDIILLHGNQALYSITGAKGPSTVFIWIEAPGAKTKFWGVPLFKKSKGPITGAALE